MLGVFITVSLICTGIYFISSWNTTPKEQYVVQLTDDENAGSQQAISESVINLYSSHILLIRLDDFETIRGFQSDETIYPASMTKMMTAILAIEALDNFDEKIIIQPSWIEELKEKNASMAGFEAEEEVSVRDLLYGVLLPSGAEAAVALSCRVSGSEEDFVRLMNEKAKSLGMIHTNFVNSTGLHDDKHVTTLQDMALLMEYALDNTVFRHIFTTHEYQTESTSVHENGIHLESTLFGKLGEAAREEDGAVNLQGELSTGWILGGKTGYTPQAGLCLASLAQIRGKEYILLTAGACGDATTLPYHIMDAVEIYKHIGSKD